MKRKKKSLIARILGRFGLHLHKNPAKGTKKPRRRVDQLASE